MADNMDKDSTDTVLEEVKLPEDLNMTSHIQDNKPSCEMTENIENGRFAGGDSEGNNTEITGAEQNKKDILEYSSSELESGSLNCDKNSYKDSTEKLVVTTSKSDLTETEEPEQKEVQSNASNGINLNNEKASYISSQSVSHETDPSQDNNKLVQSKEKNDVSLTAEKEKEHVLSLPLEKVTNDDQSNILNINNKSTCDIQQDKLNSTSVSPENVNKTITQPSTVSQSSKSPPELLRQDSDELLSELESELEKDSNIQTSNHSSNNYLDNSLLPANNSSCVKSNEHVQSCQDFSDTTTNLVKSTSVKSNHSAEIPGAALPPNGVIPPISISDIPQYKDLHKKYGKLHKYYIEKEMDVKRLSGEVSKLSNELCKTVKDRDLYIKKIEHLEDNSTEKVYLAKISELENIVAKETSEHKETKVKLASHDAAAKKAVQQIQNETQAKIAQINKVYEECKRDKEGMTVKYAMAEQKNLELQEKMTRNDRKVREMERERDNVVGRYKQMKAEKEKSDGNVLARGQEIVNLRREIEKFKEIKTDLESKAKWAHAKMKTELDGHKESKMKYEELNKKYKQLKEETDQVKRDCQNMIKEYQQNEEVKTITLAAKLDQKEQALQLQQQEKSDQEEVHMVVRNELEKLKRKHKEMVEELKTYRDKVTCLEAERLLQEETLSKFKETLQTQKQDNRDLYDRIIELEKAEVELNNAKSEIQNLSAQVSDLTENNKDLKVDIDGCAKREAGHLEFSKRVSDKNAKLQSENSVLSNKLSSLQHDYDQIDVKCKELEYKIVQLEESLKLEKHQRIEENGTIGAKLEEKTRKVDELSQELEDQKDENKTLKRRHQANIKDLTRQLQQAKRKLENSDRRSGDGRDSASMGSMGSRTSSTNSINTVGENGNTGRGGSQEPHHPLPQEDEQPIVQFVEVDKQILVEKIVKLQRMNARKSEKLEFMEDHINQLIEELQKKHKIIQNYALREETGTLAPQEMDLNKAQLSRKGGIMASIYKRHADDEHMSMDLLLEINRKLQAVLEDTLLKNITLKDNMDTLGKEIANISHSNRTLQLELQKFKGTTKKS